MQGGITLAPARDVASRLIEEVERGHHADNDGRNTPHLNGKILAEQLNVLLGDKVVLCHTKRLDDRIRLRGFKTRFHKLRVYFVCINDDCHMPVV